MVVQLHHAINAATDQVATIGRELMHGMEGGVHSSDTRALQQQLHLQELH